MIVLVDQCRVVTMAEGHTVWQHGEARIYVGDADDTIETLAGDAFDVEPCDPLKHGVPIVLGCSLVVVSK